MNNYDRPLLSFVVACYNQEAFIGEALDGVLAQTYSPLEIIVMDDCSEDGTFEIARERVARYRGPHQVRLVRNERNLGIGGNINRAMELCRGELMLLADGDDVSLPDRAEATYQAWEYSGRRATSICFGYTTISREGADLGPGGFRGDPADPSLFRTLSGDLFRFLSTRKPAVVGCSHAWSRELFHYFGPLQSDLEDLMLSFRSLAIGQILHVQRPLVKYRRHGRNVSFFAGGDDSVSFLHREKRLRWVDEQTVRAYDNMLADIEILHARGRISEAERERLRKEARRIRTAYSLERRMMDGGLLSRISTLAGAAARGNIACALRFMTRLLPPAVYRSLYLFRNRMKSAPAAKSPPAAADTEKSLQA